MGRTSAASGVRNACVRGYREGRRVGGSKKSGVARMGRGFAIRRGVVPNYFNLFR